MSKKVQTNTAHSHKAWVKLFWDDMLEKILIAPNQGQAC